MGQTLCPRLLLEREIQMVVLLQVILALYFQDIWLLSLCENDINNVVCGLALTFLIKNGYETQKISTVNL